MNSFDWPIGLRFLVALGLGFLIGLERERTRNDPGRVLFGGVRTFPILSLYGFACGWLFTAGATLVLPAGLLSLAGLTAISYTQKMKTGRFGATSEVSVLLTFVAGALALMADVRIAMALGVVVTLLLSEKSSMETWVEQLDKQEFLATVKFLLLSAIIYPALPDRSFTRFDINPARVWWIVIMVATVGFVGYHLCKRLGARVGLWLSGLMGGIVSSTAVSIAMGRGCPARSRAKPERVAG